MLCVRQEQLRDLSCRATAIVSPDIVTCEWHPCNRWRVCNSRKKTLKWISPYILPLQGWLRLITSVLAALYPWHIPFIKIPMDGSANKIAHKECGQPPVMWYNIFGDSWNTLLVLHATFRTRMDQYIGIPISRASVFKLAGICADPLADAVAKSGARIIV